MLGIVFTSCDEFDIKPDPIPNESPEVIWSQTYPVLNSAIGGVVVETSNGNFVVAGTTDEVNAYSHPNLFLLRTDSLGNEIWTQTIDLYLDYGFFKMLATSDGCFIVCCSESDNEEHLRFIILRKFDENGILLWRKSIEISDLQRLTDFIETSDGGFLFSAIINDNSVDTYNLSAIKTNSSGDLEWIAIHELDNYQYSRCAIEMDNGNLMICGKNEKESDSFHLINLILSPGGEFISTNSFTNINIYEINAATVSSSGDILITGSSISSLFLDAFIFKISPDNEMLFYNQYGGLYNESSYAIAATDDAGCLITGVTKSEGAGKEDIWIFKVDQFGAYQWRKAIGDKVNDSGNDIIVSKSGKYIATGTIYYPDTHFLAFLMCIDNK